MTKATPCGSLCVSAPTALDFSTKLVVETSHGQTGDRPDIVLGGRRDQRKRTAGIEARAGESSAIAALHEFCGTCRKWFDRHALNNVKEKP
jgi:hypothetical protein